MVFPVKNSIFSDMKNIRQHLLGHSVLFAVSLYPLPDIASQ